MGIKNIKKLVPLICVVMLCACHSKAPENKEAPKQPQPVVFKGLYSFGPENKSFKECKTGREFWAADSSAQLELQYSHLNFEKPYEPVYVELQGDKVKSAKEGPGSDYDSTLVVKKVIKITRDIPKGICIDSLNKR